MQYASPSLPGPIAYLTGEYPRATDTFIQREIAGLRDLGINVLTCSIRKTGAEHLVGEEQKREAAKTFYVLPAASAPLHLLWSHAKTLFSSPRLYFGALALALRSGAPGAKGLLYQLFYFAEAVVLASHLKRKRVVHIHNHIAMASGSVAMLASCVSGIPFSFTLHGPDIFYDPERWRLDLKIARARFVACISDFSRNKAIGLSDPSHAPKLHIVHCGVDPGRYSANASNATHNHQITFVGRLAEVKGLPVLFEAVQTVLPVFPSLRVTLIGDGPERSQLEQQVRELDLSDVVEFAGYRSQSEVAKALKQTDLFVLPSFAEGVPVVLMEAMAAQIPVIATRIAGIPELVEDGVSGALVEPGNAAQLAGKITGILGDPDVQAEMGRAGREKVLAQFNIADESAWLAELLRCYVLGQPVPGKRKESANCQQEETA
ncbi:MAG: glycosyltransferase family 4 protein [Rhodobacteraceae bacterium]|nr:glycosyltransferase family 4 protein [Paracoccaceae bacterium]